MKYLPWSRHLAWYEYWKKCLRHYVLMEHSLAPCAVCIVRVALITFLCKGLFPFLTFPLDIDVQMCVFISRWKQSFISAQGLTLHKCLEKLSENSLKSMCQGSAWLDGKFKRLKQGWDKESVGMSRENEEVPGPGLSGLTAGGFQVTIWWWDAPATKESPGREYHHNLGDLGECLQMRKDMSYIEP